MTALRGPSARPEIIVDHHPARVEAPAVIGSDTQIGRTVVLGGPLGRDRLVTALPLDGGPVQLEPIRVLHGVNIDYVADPNGALLGDRSGVWVSRMLTATVTPDTRRL